MTGDDTQSVPPGDPTPPPGSKPSEDARRSPRAGAEVPAPPPHSATEQSATEHSATEQISALREQLGRCQERGRLLELQLDTTETALWQLSSLFHRVAIPIVFADRDGLVTDLNAEAERRWNVTRSALLGKSLKAIVPEARHGRFDSLLAQCLAGVAANDVERQLWDRPIDVRSSWLTLSPTRDRQGDVIGVLLAEDPRELKATELLLESVNATLQNLALVDSLTQLANRRRFEREFETEVARAARQRQPIALLMIDVDYFKAFNDTLGHPSGDACLTQIAQTIAACLRRPADLLARYGGEEFVALLPDTDLDGATQLAERIRVAVETSQIPHPASRVSTFVTVSIGVASARAYPGFPSTRLRVAADRALYVAKGAGRNRVRGAHVMVSDQPDAQSGGAR